jgi:hypothetical protein
MYVNSNPTPEPIVPPTGGPGLTWPVYNGHYRDDLDLKYLLVDNVTNEIRTDYRQHAYSFFHEYMPYFAGYGITPPNSPIPPCKLVKLLRNNYTAARDFTNFRPTVDIVKY